MGLRDLIKKGWEENKRSNEKIKSPGLLSVFKALSICDFITPVVGIGETIYNDPSLLQTNSWTFFIDYDQSLRSGWNANDIERLLHSEGINTWGSQVMPFGEFFFSVSRDQARDAEDLLLRNNVPFNMRFAGAPPKK